MEPDYHSIGSEKRPKLRTQYEIRSFHAFTVELLKDGRKEIDKSRLKVIKQPVIATNQLPGTGMEQALYLGYFRGAARAQIEHHKANDGSPLPVCWTCSACQQGYVCRSREPRAFLQLWDFNTPVKEHLCNGVVPLLQPLEMLRFMDDKLAKIVSNGFGMGTPPWTHLRLWKTTARDDTPGSS